MLKWLKDYITPPQNPELTKLYDEAALARAQHNIALDNYHQAVEKMLRRMEKAERVVGTVKDGGNWRQDV